MEINGFYWFVKAEDFDDLGNVDIKISAGRLRHRWVPITKTAAKLFLRESAEAEGLRAAADTYIIIRVVFAEPIKDLSSDYPNEHQGSICRYTEYSRHKCRCEFDSSNNVVYYRGYAF